MAVVFDAQGHIDTGASTTATSLSGTPITVGSGANRAIGVCLTFGNTIGLPTGITVTCGGVSMTAVTGASASNGTVAASAIWFALVNPTSGTPTIAAAWTGGRCCVMGAISFTGVNQTGGVTSFAHGNGIVTSANATGSITITSATGNMTVAAHVDDGGTAINSASATQDFIDHNGNTTINQESAMHHTVGNASNVMTVTLAAADDSTGAGFDFVAASGAADILQAQIML